MKEDPLEAFLAGNWRNRWLKYPCMEVYVRKSSRVLSGQLIQCFDIGSVEVDEGYRNKGVFRVFLKRFEQIAAREGKHVFVENALNPLLADMLRRRGYQTTLDAIHCECFFLPPQ